MPKPTCCPPPAVTAPPPLSGTAYEDALAELAKAVGHPARVRILRLLADKPSCICGTIVDAVGLAQSTVSQHLAILKDAGLIRGEIDGPRTCYCLDAAAMRRLKTMIAAL
jgi:ArsR family transcriptional regulator